LGRRCEERNGAAIQRGACFAAGKSRLHFGLRARSLCGLNGRAAEQPMAAILVVLVTLALGYGAYRIIRNGFRYPQSEKLSGFGIFGFFVLIVLGAWLASTVLNRFF
jgi:hypothetical protein